MKRFIPESLFIVKVLISIVLIWLFARCADNNPYSFYELLRSAVTVGFVALIVIDLKLKYYLGLILYLAGLAYFNPISKITLARQEWLKIDSWFKVLLIVLIVLDILIFVFKKYKLNDTKNK